VPTPLERARLQLAYGAFLRRAAKRTLAAEQLVAARTTLAQLNARPDLERCERELAGCGLSSSRSAAKRRPDLTPQELAVAQLVASGLSNRHVARELVVSVKTVEYHLSHVYTTLQVSSRGQLISRLRQD
jgi:DNA-binding NarL/FixJ family response regulator